MKVYFISGLGADQRAFYKLKLPSGFEAVHLNWIKPFQDESLQAYATRFSELINKSEDFIIVGLSFGGMLAAELAKIISPEKIIIISSLSNSTELPWYFRWSGKLGLHKIIIPSVYKKATLLNRFMGAGDKEMKSIVYSYVNNIDPKFVKWSINEIIHWNNPERPAKLVHIHGASDHLLPCRYVKADYIVARGGHLMVMNHSDEVNQILAKVLTA